jgi:hypothetical protein
VGLGRVELPTSPLSGVRSSQLSYRPIRSRLSAPPRPSPLLILRGAQAPQIYPGAFTQPGTNRSDWAADASIPGN